MKELLSFVRLSGGGSIKAGAAEGEIVETQANVGRRSFANGQPGKGLTTPAYVMLLHTSMKSYVITFQI
ncbi:hypothetical protein FHS82_001738 [Pseudochelatococcus lubricantis]|uniref:Uncharacterized protein n=1 Tax=Pseudochelatococcus lubricantis TaxID=1538102 RepID=A0ABX0UY78_9HYPH|nr:hypothetical protein [Pseudochelatococcus lubricantis]NIJ57902.1 hypothetical protein [Pseudochelatococcus lubricantis]